MSLILWQLLICYARGDHSGYSRQIRLDPQIAPRAEQSRHMAGAAESQLHHQPAAGAQYAWSVGDDAAVYLISGLAGEKAT